MTEIRYITKTIPEERTDKRPVDLYRMRLRPIISLIKRLKTLRLLQSPSTVTYDAEIET
jgi:hypothetical protein